MNSPQDTNGFKRLDELILPFACRTLSKESAHFILLPTFKAASQLAAALRMMNREFEESRSVVVLPELPAGKLLTLEQETEFLSVLFSILQNPPTYLIASAGTLVERAPAPRELAESRFEISEKTKPGFNELLSKLVALNYDDEFEVTSAGEFSRRGGIIDVFSPAENFPVRLEFWGDELENIRRFSPETQRSNGRIESYEIIARTLPGRDEKSSCVADYVKKLNLKPLLIYPDECYLQLRNFASEERLSRFSSVWSGLTHRQEWGGATDEEKPRTRKKPVPLFPCFPAVAHLSGLLPDEILESSLKLVREQIASQVKQWLACDYTVVLGGLDDSSREHIQRWKEVYNFDDENLITADAAFPCGVIFPELKIVFLNEKELFAVHLKISSANDENDTSAGLRRFKLDSSDIIADLSEGDCAVHLNYGIAIFRGIKVLAGRGSRREVMVLEYAEEKMLYVPLTQAHLVSRYMGAAGKVPLHRLNSKKWSTDRIGALRSVRAYAADLLRMQAVRRSVENLPLPPENYEQAAFESGCGFELTVDQSRAVAEIKADLAGKHPMDRLLCGDVGFGKTEVAMQGAFRMVCSGYQVAVLAPTTILAQQHYYSFKERFAEYPIIIEMVSRFRTPQEQKKILEQAREGKVDIVIGTHRLCQSDVKFANLGLVVVDEEQRFGVKHKEMLRSVRASANVLSMSATPIPRTLYLAMAGARDLSTIMSPPRARLPVKTLICGEKDPVWSGTINMELSRGGQVYYLHNRVKTIQSCADSIRKLFPVARVAIAHGQMDEDELEHVMAGFLDGKIDILVCTTIVESGLDVPNANTIVIERADRFGLAELYQLRGRVGRSTQQAYSCLLLPKSEIMTLDGRKRIAAIRRYSHLGAGFQLALRDLEIRGSGNLLGEEQSGYVKAIGFELYCQLLSAEIKNLKGEKVEFLPEVDFSAEFVIFGWEVPEGMAGASLPPSYIESEKLRVEAYRKLARTSREEELETVRAEFIDRYGKLPKVAENMFIVTLIRILAARSGYVSVSVGDETVICRTAAGTPFRVNGKLPLIKATQPAERKLIRLLEIARTFH